MKLGQLSNGERPVSLDGAGLRTVLRISFSFKNKEKEKCTIICTYIVFLIDAWVTHTHFPLIILNTLISKCVFIFIYFDI